MSESAKSDRSLKGLLTGEHALTMRILLAIILAFALALGAPHLAAKFHIGGEIFLMILKMMVVPLVVTSVMSGILGMGDVRKLGKPGGAALGYYLVTTLIAVIIGIIVVNLVQPGVGTVSPDALAELAQDEGQKEGKAAKLAALSSGEKQGIGTILENLGLMLFTDNLVKSAANLDLLPLIVFSLLFAAVLTTMGRERVGGLTTLIEQANDAFMAFVLALMKVAPIGIFCLVASRFGEAAATGTFGQELAQIGRFFGTVLAALALHAFIVLPLILWVTTRRNPLEFMFNMSRALLTAFSTASSSATLPLTMETAIDKAGVSERSAKFVLPIGATINMDGTALYEAVAAIFVAQVAAGAGVIEPFTLGDQVIVAVTATLAAIGAAGIPEAGLVTMIIVFNAVGLPVEYIGLILSVDWLLDRFRTTVNVFGDAVGAAVVEQTFEEEREPG